MLTTAKALGGGLPVGACVAAPELADTLQAGDHGSTFAGGSLVAAAALAAFDVIDDPALLRGVRELGGRLRDGLEAMPGVDGGAGPRADARGRPGRRERRPSSADALLAEGLVVNAPDPSARSACSRR